MRRVGPESAAVVSELIKATADPHPQVRMNATMALTACGPRAAAAVPALILAMKRPENIPIIRPFNLSIRQQACRALAKIGPAAGPAVPDLTDALIDGNPGVRMNAVIALGRIGFEARPVLEKIKLCLSDESPDVRDEAAHSMRLLSE